MSRTWRRIESAMSTVLLTGRSLADASLGAEAEGGAFAVMPGVWKVGIGILVPAFVIVNPGDLLVSTSVDGPGCVGCCCLLGWKRGITGCSLVSSG